MSVLTLDATQRIQLNNMIGAQNATVDDMRIFWRLQDQIGLSLDEKQAVSYRIEEVNGQPPQILWNATPGLVQPKVFEFTPEEAQKLLRIVKEWKPGFMTGMDRLWLEPLLGQLENGSGSTQQSPIPTRNQ